MSRPPVAWTRSTRVIRYCAAGMLGRSRHRRRSAGAPSRASARRMISTVSHVVRLLLGCGEKMTASRHFTAYMPTPGGVSSGLVVGTSDAMSPTGFAYLTMPRSGSVSITPMLFWRSRSRRIPMTLKRFETRLSRSPIPLSSTPMWASRVKVVSLATAQPIAWQSRSTSSWVAPSNARRAARPLATKLVDVCRFLGRDRSRRHADLPQRAPEPVRPVGCRSSHYCVSPTRFSEPCRRLRGRA